VPVARVHTIGHSDEDDLDVESVAGFIGKHLRNRGTERHAGNAQPGVVRGKSSSESLQRVVK
jgi:hypothetical protein